MNEQRCLVIAEVGVNHNGDLSLARKLVDAAVDVGADVVKFQTFVTEKLVTQIAPKALYQLTSQGDSESQFAMLKRLELTPQDYEILVDHCQDRGIEFLSTPFDLESVALLVDLGVARLKIPSGEINNGPLLECVASQSKPVILSTGMAYLGEVEEAVRLLQCNGCMELSLLHCTSAYPSPPIDANLRAMLTMRHAFGLPVGYSDHTEGTAVSLAAVALGAAVIEKHLTLDKNLYGPDHRASLEPEEFRALVEGTRSVEVALGDGVKHPTASEENTRQVARRSIVAARNLKSGTLLRAVDMMIKRPGTGIPSDQMQLLVGRVLQRDLATDALISWDDLL